VCHVLSSNSYLHINSSKIQRSAMLMLIQRMTVTWNEPCLADAQTELLASKVRAFQDFLDADVIVPFPSANYIIRHLHFDTGNPRISSWVDEPSASVHWCGGHVKLFQRTLDAVRR